MWWSQIEGDWNRCWSNWCGSQCNLEGQGTSPVAQDILGEGRLVRAYLRVNADVGKTVTIFGTDNGGQTLMHQDETGAWREGKVLTLAKPYVSTDTYVRHIDRVLKYETEGVIDLYAYNVAGDVLEDLAHYDPSEVNPSFAKYKLHAPRCGSGNGSCGNIKSIVALVKLKFIAAKHDTDLVLIENLDALKDQMQSIKEREARNVELAQELEASAIRELNLDLYNRDQNNIPITLGVLGNTDVGMQLVY